MYTFMFASTLAFVLVSYSVDSFCPTKRTEIDIRRLHSVADFSLQSNLFMEYGNLLKSKNAVPTKMITSGLIAVIGNVIQQIFVNGLSFRKFDYRGLLVFTLVNIFYIGPISHFWFKLLETMTTHITSKLLKATVQVFVDQTLGAFVITGGFLAIFEVVDRSVPNQNEDNKRSESILTTIYNACNMKLMRTLISTWYDMWTNNVNTGSFPIYKLTCFHRCYWPFLNFINFLGTHLLLIYMLFLYSTYP